MRLVSLEIITINRISFMTVWFQILVKIWEGFDETFQIQ